MFYNAIGCAFLFNTHFVVYQLLLLTRLLKKAIINCFVINQLCRYNMML